MFLKIRRICIKRNTINFVFKDYIQVLCSLVKQILFNKLLFHNEQHFLEFRSLTNNDDTLKRLPNVKSKFPRNTHRKLIAILSLICTANKIVILLNIVNTAIEMPTDQYETSHIHSHIKRDSWLTQVTNQTIGKSKSFNIWNFAGRDRGSYYKHIWDSTCDVVNDNNDVNDY